MERQQVFYGVKKLILCCSTYRQGNQLITDTAVVCCNYLPVVSRKMLQFETKLWPHNFPSVLHNNFGTIHKLEPDRIVTLKCLDQQIRGNRFQQRARYTSLL